MNMYPIRETVTVSWSSDPPELANTSIPLTISKIPTSKDVEIPIKTPTELRSDSSNERFLFPMYILKMQSRFKLPVSRKSLQIEMMKSHSSSYEFDI